MAEKHKVLFVDDEIIVGRTFVRMASKLGYQAEWVSSGVEAIDQVRKQYYPIILTDLNMPGLDGLALLECLRGLSPTSVTMLVSGDPALELPDPKGNDCSLAGVLHKPICFQTLERALAQASEMVKLRLENDGAILKKILLVDADQLDSQLTKARLQRDMPCSEMTHVTTIEEAQRHCCDDDFELVITELALPDARGVEAVTRLHHLFPNAAIVVLSSSGNESVALQALKTGAQDYLLKDRVDGPNFKRAVRYAVERKTSEKNLLRLAYYDHLTGLANRQLFQDRLVQALARVNRTKGELSVVFMDLDRFKAVNDSLGHEVGDKLLQVIANRLLACVRQTDTVARLGGDEFAILFEGAPEHEVSRLGYRLIEAVCQPMELAGERVCVGTSLGAAAYPKHGFTADGLLRAADSAMYKSKQAGRGRLSWAGEETNVHALRRLRLESELRQALSKGQFELLYQPQVRPATGGIESVEVFLRWRNNEGQLISPGGFLPMLNEMGLMPEVGAWVVHKACHQAAQWRNKDWRVAVNLGSQQITTDFVDVVDQAIRESGLSPDRLELELTELDILKNSEQVASVLDRFTERGVGLVLDDFGTGYSSLSYLKRFPVNAVKLDGKFLAENDGSKVTRAVIDLVHALDLKVVAEGVETQEQFDKLSRQGCDRLQGFFLARPMDCDSLGQWGCRQAHNGNSLAS